MSPFSPISSFSPSSPSFSLFSLFLLFFSFSSPFSSPFLLLPPSSFLLFNLYALDCQTPSMSSHVQKHDHLTPGKGFGAVKKNPHVQRCFPHLVVVDMFFLWKPYVTRYIDTRQEPTKLQEFFLSWIVSDNEVKKR